MPQSSISPSTRPPRLMARASNGDIGRELGGVGRGQPLSIPPILTRTSWPGGVDRSGRELRLDRGYVSNGLRWSAQEIATEELGPRREADVRRAYAREINQERFTALDRELERRTGSKPPDRCPGSRGQDVGR